VSGKNYGRNRLCTGASCLCGICGKVVVPGD